MIPNGPPFSPNYVHITDVAFAHVIALRISPLDPPQRKHILLVAGYVLWSEIVLHCAEAMPENLRSKSGFRVQRVVQDGDLPNMLNSSQGTRGRFWE